jgi:signal transduction histidine kinase
MKPLLAESEDNEALRLLGRASVQIVHDLKNHLNGLKLYATFLRKRLERHERPADELETVNKLITGLDRTAADLSLIVEYGQPLKVNKQPGANLEKIITGVVDGLNHQPPTSGSLAGAIVINTESSPLMGGFDSLLLAEALKLISVATLKMRANKASDGPLEIRVKSEGHGTGRDCVIEWQASTVSDHDPFHSFAGSNEIRLALAARIIEAHGGSAERRDGNLRVRLPLTT